MIPDAPGGRATERVRACSQAIDPRACASGSAGKSRYTLGMPTRFVEGDLFARPRLPGLAHGCNCAGAMGKGIAVAFRSEFPAMYAEYKRRCTGGMFAPGDVFVWDGGATTVFNLGTHQSWRSPADLDAIKASAAKMVAEADRLGVERIGLPQLGAGLGKLDWRVVKKVLVRAALTANVELIVAERFVRGQALG